jgi:Flp pilus assembly pilin Flp
MLKTSRPLRFLVAFLSATLLLLPIKAAAGLIEYALILYLIAILQISTLKLHDSALAAAQFEDLQAVAEGVLVLTETGDSGPPVLVTETSGLLVNALGEAQELVTTAQDEQQPPDPATVAAVLQDLATAEAALQQDLAALNTPASAHVAGELEAYLNLKHALQEVIAEVQVADIQITKVFDKATKL